jgi:hypothetical protein
MAVAYDGGASDITTSTLDTSMVVAAPAGSGGRLYAIGNCAAARTIAPPSGWTEVVNDASAADRTYLWMRADDAASDYTFTLSGTFNNGVVSVHRLSGAGTGTPTTGFADGTNSQTQTCPTITTPSDNCMVFWGCYRGAASGPSTADKGTERVDVSDAVSGAYQGIYTNLEATAGSITGAVITTTGFGVKRVFSVAVESAAATGNPWNAYAQQ